jgi:hypothetical protein
MRAPALLEARIAGVVLFRRLPPLHIRTTPFVVPLFVLVLMTMARSACAALGDVAQSRVGAMDYVGITKV